MFPARLEKVPLRVVLVLPFVLQILAALGWIIVIVIPESDFLAQIYENNQATLGLCLLSVAIALLIGVLTARWITQPLLELNTAAKKALFCPAPIRREQCR